LAQVDEDEVFLSVVSLAELRRGVGLLDTAVDGGGWRNG